ncbi:MAG TPA: MraY family glycosyltransferase, partial [Phenylobacterium sp.]|nr:MraY family glycosyltransferase [Phenylobacterium sp.]
DDAIDLHWWWRILAQLVAGGAVIAGGVQVAQIGPVFGFGPLALGDFSVVFTLLAVVGLVNALNMIDGVDGLAGSVGFVCLAMLAGAAVYAGNIKLVVGLLLVLSTLAAFLVFNFRLPGGPPARIFLGDAGSGLLGLIIAWSAFRLTQSPTYPVSPILAPFLVAVPVLDCLVLMGRRIVAGKSPFEGDRNHLHHILSDAGYAPHEICAVVAVSSLALGLAAAGLLKMGAPQPLLLIIFCSLLIVHWGVTARRARAVRFYAGFRRQAPATAAVRSR